MELTFVCQYCITFCVAYWLGSVFIHFNILVILFKVFRWTCMPYSWTTTISTWCDLAAHMDKRVVNTSDMTDITSMRHYGRNSKLSRVINKCKYDKGLVCRLVPASPIYRIWKCPYTEVVGHMHGDEKDWNHTKCSVFWMWSMGWSTKILRPLSLERPQQQRLNCLSISSWRHKQRFVHVVVSVYKDQTIKVPVTNSADGTRISHDFWDPSQKRLDIWRSIENKIRTN